MVRAYTTYLYVHVVYTHTTGVVREFSIIFRTGTLGRYVYILYVLCILSILLFFRSARTFSLIRT